MAELVKPTTHKFSLTYPIVIGTGETLTEIPLRRVTAGDHRRAAQMHKDPVACEYAVMAAVSGLQAEDFDLLDWEDVNRIRLFLFGEADRAEHVA